MAHAQAATPVAQAPIGALAKAWANADIQLTSTAFLQTTG